jgi:hypothetical protein
MEYDYTRADWEVRPFITGPVFTWSTVDRIVIHYRGTGGVPVPDDIAQSLRNSQAYWLRSRGYSLGYNAAVVSSRGHRLDGTTWEIRGDTFRDAATGGINQQSFAILVMQVDNEPATPKAIDGIRDLVRQCRGRAPVHLPIVGHGFSGSTTATACPGVGLSAQIRAGVFEPPVPLPLPDDDEDDMARYWRDERYHDVFQISPSVAPVPSVPAGATVEVGRHHRVLRACAKMCNIGSVSRWEDWADIPVDALPDEPT